ncbi:Fe2+ transport system protein FeoA [Thermococcus stetteri]|nr:Fe2+ transport system protein FeoA [Thermococcus stetteri]
MKGHDAEKTFRFRIDGREVILGDGEAAKILMRSGEGLIQANFLKGKGIMEKVIGGRGVKERLGDVEGKGIKLVSVEERKAHEERGGFVIVRVNGREVVLGRGLAEKVWVR